MEGLIIFQVYIGVTVSRLICHQLLQLSKKVLEVILLGRSVGYFWGYYNGINGRVAFRNSGLRLGWERV